MGLLSIWLCDTTKLNKSGLHFIQNKYSLLWIMVKKNIYGLFDFIFKRLFILHGYVI